MKTKNHFTIVVLFTSPTVLVTLPARAQQTEGSPLAEQTWVRLGGPIGGIGYDIRMRPDNPDIMYVTDAWAGVHKSTDGGRTWFTLNEGIDVRTGPSGDAIPVFCLTIDPNNYDILWIGLQNLGAVYRSVDGGQTWKKQIKGIVECGSSAITALPRLNQISRRMPLKCHRAAKQVYKYLCSTGEHLRD